MNYMHSLLEASEPIAGHPEEVGGLFIPHTSCVVQIAYYIEIRMCKT